MRKAAPALAASHSALPASEAGHACGGMAAVGMNEATQIGEVETRFRAEVSLETQERNVETVI